MTLTVSLIAAIRASGGDVEPHGTGLRVTGLDMANQVHRHLVEVARAHRAWVIEQLATSSDAWRHSRASVVARWVETLDPVAALGLSDACEATWPDLSPHGQRVRDVIARCWGVTGPELVALALEVWGEDARPPQRDAQGHVEAPIDLGAFDVEPSPARRSSTGSAL